MYYISYIFISLARLIMSQNEDKSRNGVYEPFKNPLKRLKKAQSANIEQNREPCEAEEKKMIQMPDFRKTKTMDTHNVDDLDCSEELNNDKNETSDDHKDDTSSEASYYSDNQNDENHDQKKPSQKDLQNLQFYLNKIPSRPQGDLIENILKNWKKNYRKLEIHHGYIQWLFPNFYKSVFNRDANPLLPEEANIFRENKEIADRLVRSYELILDFYGMKLKDKKTGKLERAEHYLERYKATLITSLHNHLRIRRILAHLNVVGFRSYAIELVNFLEIEMTGEIGGSRKYQLHQYNPQELRAMKSCPLYPILKYDVFKDWKIYGACQTKEDWEILYKNCFTSTKEDYATSIYLKV